LAIADCRLGKISALVWRPALSGFSGAPRGHEDRDELVGFLAKRAEALLRQESQLLRKFKPEQRLVALLNCDSQFGDEFPP